jgi:hypothetical protein
MQIVVVSCWSEKNGTARSRETLTVRDDASVYAGAPEDFDSSNHPIRDAVAVRHLGGPPLWKRPIAETEPCAPLQALASDLLAREVARALPSLEGYRHLDDLKRALEACGELAVSNRLKPYDYLDVGGKIVGKVERDEG